ncbi:glycosyl hydrolase [Synechococcus phage Yong-M3-232]|nr:glycosyl hydrolase [Synechococcus phage Yong-M3-232]
MTQPNNPRVPEKRVVTSKRAGIGTAVAAIIAAVFAVEGGFVDHKDDPGGATNMGITERVARQHGYSGDMRDLTRDKAFAIYERDYIERPGYLPLITIDKAVAEEVIDTAVNMGPARPSRYFQRAVNEVCNTTLTIDGRIGPITVKAWADCRANLGPKACVRMLDSLDRQQEAEYDRLVRVNPRLRVFYRGWINHRIGNVDRSRCA